MGFIDAAITGIGFLWAAVVGLLYFFSRDFRARKKKEWRSQRGGNTVSEWGFWLFSIFIVLVILALMIAAYVNFSRRL